MQISNEMQTLMVLKPITGALAERNAKQAAAAPVTGEKYINSVIVTYIK